MNDRPDAPELSLLGGPLHRLGVRLGLVRERTNTVRLGLALAGILWGGLLTFALFEGLGATFFSLAVIGVHARFLVAIALMFACETLLAPCAAEFVASLRRSGLLSGAGVSDLDAEVRREVRRRDSWAAEAVCLVAGASVAFFAAHVGLMGTSAVRNEAASPVAGPLTTGWYWYVCLPVFRFLVFRWIWRLVLWWSFLRRLAALDLVLVPTHPDAAGGIGYLEVVQTQFGPLAAAVSVVQASALAEEIAAGRMQIEGTFPAVAFVILLDAVLFVAPVLLFTGKLYSCRVRGLSRYMDFATDYVQRFDSKWIDAGTKPAEPVLGTADVQSLADLGTSVTQIQDMRIVVVSRRMIAGLAAAAVVPMLPLLLFKYPVTELAEKFVRSVTGL